MSSYEPKSSMSSNMQFPRPPVYPDNPCELFNLSSRLLLPLYDITKCLGKGGFGAVYQATDRNHRQCAIKIQSKDLDKNNPTLIHELRIYQRLHLDKRTGFPTTGIPKVYDYMQVENHEFLIMEQCGDSIETIMGKHQQGTISKKSAIMIAIQSIRVLETLHAHGILHRDIKPANIAMGLGPKDERTAHFLDFGLATFIDDWDSYSIDGEMPFSGTDYFACFEALFKKKPTRTGDIQSLAYTILCMAVGELPWSYLDEETGVPLTLGQLGIQRIRIKADKLCRDFPELTQFMKVALRTTRKQIPDYDKLVDLLEEALWNMNCENDGKFEWLERSSFESRGITKEYAGNTTERDVRLSPDHFYGDYLYFKDQSYGIHAPSARNIPVPSASRVLVPASPRVSVASTSRALVPESSRASFMPSSRILVPDSLTDASASRVLVPDSSVITDSPSTRVILEQTTSKMSRHFAKLGIFKECSGETKTEKVTAKLPVAGSSWNIKDRFQISSRLDRNVPVTNMPLPKGQYGAKVLNHSHGSQTDLLKQESHTKDHQKEESHIKSNLRDVPDHAPINSAALVEVPANEAVSALSGAEDKSLQASEQDCPEHVSGNMGNDLPESLKSIVVHDENSNRLNDNPLAVNKHSVVYGCEREKVEPRRRAKRTLAKKVVIKGVNWLVRKVGHDSISSLAQCGGLLA